ncbi:MAG: ABC transporter permease [Chloroflexales bacterium]|nr:ABC transporter permease [Chloroflexales bacterium]
MAATSLPQLNNAGEAGRARRSQRARRFAVQHWVALLGGAVFFAAVLIALLAPAISPYDPAAQDVPARLQGPTLAHPLGTDDFGRDTLSRMLWGARPILLAGIVSVALSLVVGALIGIVAGYFGGWIDSLLMRIIDVMLSFPIMLLAILVVTTLGPGLNNAIIAIAFAQVPIFARLVRALVLGIVHNEYIDAARALGVRQTGIMARHILPNMLGPTIVQASAALALAIGYSAALSFLGLGVQPPTADWGVMVSDGRRLIFSNPLVPFIPGAAITLTVVGLNFLGDGLRDWLDPTSR